MSHCLICGADVDISRDFCADCEMAQFWESVGNGRPIIERQIIGWQWRRGQTTDAGLQAECDQHLAALRSELETIGKTEHKE